LERKVATPGLQMTATSWDWDCAKCSSHRKHLR